MVHAGRCCADRGMYTKRGALLRLWAAYARCSAAMPTQREEAAALVEMMRKAGVHQALNEVCVLTLCNTTLSAAPHGFATRNTGHTRSVRDGHAPPVRDARVRAGSRYPDARVAHSLRTMLTRRALRSEILAILGKERVPPNLADVKLPLRSKDAFMTALDMSNLALALKPGVAVLDDMRRNGEALKEPGEAVGARARALHVCVCAAAR